MEVYQASSDLVERIIAASGYASTSCWAKMAAGKSATPWIHLVSQASIYPRVVHTSASFRLRTAGSGRVLRNRLEFSRNHPAPKQALCPQDCLQAHVSTSPGACSCPPHACDRHLKCQSGSMPLQVLDGFTHQYLFFFSRMPKLL